MLPIVIRPVPESKCSLLTDEVFVVDSFVVQPLWQNFVEQANCICSNSHGACNDSYVILHHAFPLPTRNIHYSGMTALLTTLDSTPTTELHLITCDRCCLAPLLMLRSL